MSVAQLTTKSHHEPSRKSKISNTFQLHADADSQ